MHYGFKFLVHLFRSSPQVALSKQVFIGICLLSSAFYFSTLMKTKYCPIWSNVYKCSRWQNTLYDFEMLMLNVI